MIKHYDSGLVTGWLDQQRVNMRIVVFTSLHEWHITDTQTYLFYTQCAMQVQFLIVREIYKIIIEWVQNDYK